MKATKTHIYFWGGIFSNFYLCSIEYDGKYFSSSEQLFMYLKALYFKDETVAEQILVSCKPKDAKMLGRAVKNFKNEDWDKVKTGIMCIALKHKFDSNPDLKETLINNSNRTFVEASPHDKIWGVGMTEFDPDILDESKWIGENLLGKCLNKVANDYKNS